LSITLSFSEPENQPEPPSIIKRSGNTMEIKITETSNSNGPITFYLVIVLNKDKQQIFDESLLKSYDEAKKRDTAYYIAARLKPEVCKKPFEVFNSARDFSRTFKIILLLEMNDIMRGTTTPLWNRM
jgi:hypothetical protein